jgi:hypothetical protein
MVAKAKLVSASINQLVRFYQEELQAKMIDRSDNYTCLQVGCSLLELFCGDVAKQSLISLELESVDQLKGVVATCQSVTKQISLEQYQGGQAFVAQVKDPDGNLIQLSCYQYMPKIELLA